MKKGLWNRRMPTLLAFVLLFISIWITSYLIQTGVIVVGRASPDKNPQNIRISNITSSSFTVTFTTNEKATGAISFEEVGKISALVFDDRDKDKSTKTEFYSHYITVSNLTPQTPYNFTVIVDGENFQDGDKKFFIRTAPQINDPLPSQTPISGKGLLPDGTAAQDTIAELAVPGGQFITTLTKNSGEFTIPTNTITTDSLDRYLQINPKTPITITLRRQDLSSTIKVLAQNSESLGNITLGQNYDFTEIDEIKPSSNSSILRVPTTGAISGNIRIITPRLNESFVDSRPRFRGTALPNQKVKIKIESQIIIDEVTTDQSGIWSYRPPTSIGPGQHKITIETVDSFGVIKTITQTFTVFASGSQVAESATPSATPIATLTPTQSRLTLTPTPSLNLTPSATPIPTPTLTATPTPTQIVVPSQVNSPTQLPITTPAPTGNNSTLILTAISILFIFAGAALLFAL